MRDEPAPTPRELQVLRLICEGHSTKQVAGLLGISTKTAACHRMRLMEKANVHDPINLLRWAIRRGYVTVERPSAPAREPEPETVSNWSVTIGDGAMVGKLTFAIDQARKRFLDVSRELGQAAGEVSMGIHGPDRILRFDPPEDPRRVAYEEYQKARRNLDEFLLAESGEEASGKEI